MADQKISELTAITGANTADDDELVIVDTSASQTKKITLGELENALAERDFTFPDDEQLRFGDDNDLRIFHNGTASYIRNDTGPLYIRTEANDADVLIQSDNGTGGIATYFTADGSNGQAKLHYYGSAKLNTNNTGINVTGTITGDGLTIVNGSSSTYASVGYGGNESKLSLYSNTNSGQTFLLDQSAQGVLGTSDDRRLVFYTDDTERMRISGVGAFVWNENSNDTDFRIEGNSKSYLFFVEAGTDHIGIGESDPDALLHVRETTTGNIAIFETENGGGSAGPDITLRRTSATPADGDYVGRIRFNAKNSADELLDYAQITAYLDDVTDATEDGRLMFSARRAGTLDTRLTVRGTEVIVNDIGHAGTDFRVESDNQTHLLFADASSTGKVGIRTGSPQSALDIRTTTGAGYSGTFSGNDSFTPTSGEVQIKAERGADGIVGDYTGLRFKIDGDGSGVATASIIASRLAAEGNGSTALSFMTRNDTSSLQEHMRIMDTGLVGINEQTPHAMLQVRRTHNTLASILSNSNYVASFTSDTGIGDTDQAVGIHLAGVDTNTRGVVLAADDRDSGNTHDFVIATSASASTPTERVRVSGGNLTTVTITSNESGGSAGPYLDLYRNSSTPADSDIIGRMRFQGENDAGEKITYADILNYIRDASDGTEDAEFRISTRTAGSLRNRMRIYHTFTAFNEDSQNIDFRVEGQSRSHAFFVDASAGDVVINGSGPLGNGRLTVRDDGNHAYVSSSINNGGGLSLYKVNDDETVKESIGIHFRVSGNNGTQNAEGGITYFQPSGTEHAGIMSFQTRQSSGTRYENLRFNSESGAIFNEGSANVDFRVESNNSTGMLFVDGSADKVGVNTGSPSGTLTVVGDIHQKDGDNRHSVQKRIYEVDNTGGDGLTITFGFTAGASRGFTGTFRIFSRNSGAGVASTSQTKFEFQCAQTSANAVSFRQGMQEILADSRFDDGVTVTSGTNSITMTLPSSSSSSGTDYYTVQFEGIVFGWADTVTLT